MSFNPTNDDKQKKIGDFGPGAGKVSYGTRRPRFFTGKTAVLGPVDPLTGRESDGRADKLEDFKTEDVNTRILSLMEVFQDILNELRAEHPMVRLDLEAGIGTSTQRPWTVNQNEARSFIFRLSGKDVAAQKFFLQNNSAQTVYINWGRPATAGKCAILAGQFINMEVEIYDVWIKTATGTLEVDGDTAANIFVAAWGSQNQMYGSTQ